MQNAIREIKLTLVRVEPTEAEVWLSVYPERLTSTTQAVGRLMGPRCRYASTVEVAYPWRERSRQIDKERGPMILSRVIIPEPCLWDPISPFLYEGVIELWEDNLTCMRAEVSCGLCHAKLVPRGLRWNGKPISVLGVERSSFEESEVAGLRLKGFNTLLLPARKITHSALHEADHVGLLLIGRVETNADVEHALGLADHPSMLGWLADQNSTQSDNGLEPILKNLLKTGRLVGLDLRSNQSTNLASPVDFLMCDEELLPAFERVAAPKLIYCESRIEQRQDDHAAPAPSGVLGWIHS